ncbi:MAG: vanadium-dependent haloperoxidase [Verrucomicrobiales bacterium]|nr:vanadium-dependent haloperoxidase [Verrucomicrobiales bacterium]
MTLLLQGLASADNLVVVWNDLALRAIRDANVPPPAAVRQMAVVHVSIYDAAAGIANEQCLWIKEKPEADCSMEAAISESAYRTLRTLFPKSAEIFDSHQKAILAALPTSTAKPNGIKWGAHVAREILKLRQFDGAGESTSYNFETRPGFWQRTLPNYDKPLLPNWGRLKTFGIPAIEAFRPPPPPALSSSEWAAQYNLLKRIGATNSTVRTPEQREIALFWADGPNTETPPGHWNRIAQQVAERKGYDILECARLFAALNVALADAAIVCWDAKYTYNFWRPITAIRAGETDGNSETEPDPKWLPLLFTPSFPEYTSGHSTFSGAAAEVLAQMTGSDEFQFITTSDGLPGVVRRFRRFSDAAKEAGMSRIYGGIHFPAANEQGLESGRKVGLYVTQHLFGKARAPADTSGTQPR